MSKTKVWYLETHTPVFHPKGLNMGCKIFTDGRPHQNGKYFPDIEINYCDDDGEIEIIYQGIKTFLGITAYAQWAPYPDEPVKAPVNEHKTEDKSKRSSAQVATPQSHVFEGRGQGRK